MNYVRIALTISLIFFNYFIVQAQPGNAYTAEWNKVEQLEKKGLTRDALKAVEKIFAAATKANNQTQQVKAVMYQVKYRNLVEEDNLTGNIYYLDTLIMKSKTPVKNILQSMQAELLQNYRDQNRYRLYNRTELTNEKDRDIATWSLVKLNATIGALYKQSLNNEPVLKATSLNGFEAILQQGNSRSLRPTLYDFLAHRALLYFMHPENDLTSPSFKFILNDEKLFAPVKTFVQTNFVTKDTGSLFYNAILLVQDILRFHLNDQKADALLDADLIRLSFANEHGVFQNKSKLYENALLNIEQGYPSSPYAAQAMYLRAQEYVSRGGAYNPVTAKQNQFEIKKARELAEEIIQKYPSTSGAANAKNLLQQIKMPSISLVTEKVSIPGEASRSLVKYKNVPTLHFRLIKTSRAEIEKIERTGYEKLWPALLKLNVTKNWSVNLPDPGDHQEHSTEIKVDALPSGTYMLLSSIDPDFKLENNMLCRQVFFMSNISYIYNDKKEIYVLHRSTGLPLANAEVQFWDQQYDYNTRRQELQKKEKYNSNKNGLVNVLTTGNRYNSILQIKYNQEELFTDDRWYSYDYNGYRPQTQKRTFLFTDRSIYRPGQKIFFKGIVVSTDTTGRKSTLLAGYTSPVWLIDANGQKISTLTVSTNEYGSFNGSFQLPGGLMNGRFYLKDSTNNSTQEIQVEEYKRPKFFTEIKKPEGTYRINDIITVKGNAKAYAGNNIDGAKVSYRVTRMVRFPPWWGWGSYARIWPPYGRTEEMEITNGETNTDADGNFTISFRAIPDETVDKTAQPIFHYEINADVTDINGETRSGMVSVAVAYQALQLSIAGEDKFPVDSLNNIKISSKNLNDLFEKATVNITIYKLMEPARMFRKRYWEMPDQFTLTKEEYYKSFPFDVYADEDQPQKWANAERLADISTTTNEQGSVSFGNLKPSPGMYKIIVTTKDKYGEEVRAEKFVRITDDKNPAGQTPALFIANKKTTEPGNKIEYALHTGFENIWLIHNVVKPAENRNTLYSLVKSTSPFINQFNITENDRGGVNLDYVFVKNNRVYSGRESINVPWSNKDLQVSYETFRDKILPGSEEKWTVKISGSKGEKLAAEMLVNMYDASLDQFKPHSWDQLKSLWPTNNIHFNWTSNNFSAVNAEEKNTMKITYSNPKEIVYDVLLYNGWNEDYLEFKMMSRKDNVKGAVVLANAAPAPPEISQAKFAPPKIVKDEDRKSGEEISSSTDSAFQKTNLPGNNDNVQIRKNFNETAFFFPALTTDQEGNISFNFTIPEALTQWKLMTLAHDKQLASGYSEKTVITQKPLMVQPNAPRFIREGDRMELVAKLVNLSDKEITGTTQLELMNALTNTPVDGWFKNVFPTQYFTVAAGQSVAVKFPVDIPFNFNSVLSYRIKAISKDGSFSDGEEAAIPVLTNRMLVTETFPINTRNTNNKQFRFEKLLASGNSETLTHHALTVEYTSNPAWYAVQALPYLMEFPYECAEQNFNRYYANVLAGFVANSTPKIKAVFEKWKGKDSSALLSNLQKNEELKSALLEETPWVMEAKNENEQKKNIAILFDLVRLSQEKTNSLNKFKEMQSPNGGFTWFKGGPDDRFITQYIITGIGHLRKLNALSPNEYPAVKPVTDKALPYLDNRLKEEYEALVKSKANLSQNHLSYTAIQYLYMRSFFPETAITAAAKTAVAYFKKQAAQYWLSNNKYMQAMIALALHRSQDTNTAKGIINSLKQNAIYSEELGMYFKDQATGGYYWQQAPVESQALIIEAFTDIDGNNKTIDDLKTWLLKQKQTQNWRTTKATADACYALLLNGSNWLTEETTVNISLNNQPLTSFFSSQLGAYPPKEEGTGYTKQTIPGNLVKPGMGNISVVLNPGTSQIPATTGGKTTWGAIYWQYFEDLDKITGAATPLTLVKKLYIEKKSDRGPVLQELKEGDELHIGDKVKVRIELRADRDMEYIHLKDMRAAAMEPVNVISQYKWQGGLGYYESTRDASTNFFFSQLPRGTYVFEYPMFVTHKGNFSNGIASIQCMYAPEFSSHSDGIRVDIE